MARRWLKRIGILFGSLITIVLLIVLTVWMFPQLILNNRLVRYAIRHQSTFVFAPETLPELQFEVTSDSFTRKHLTLQTGAFCMDAADQSVHACIQRIAFDLTFGFDRHLRPILYRAGTVDFHLKEAWLQSDPPNSTPPEDRAPPPASGPSRFRPRFAEDFRAQPFSIEVDRFVIGDQTDRERKILKASLTASRDSVERDLDFLIDASLDSRSDPRKIVLHSGFSLNRARDVDGNCTVSARSNGKRPRVEMAASFKVNLRSLTGRLSGKAKLIDLTPALALVEIDRFVFEKTNQYSFDSDLRGTVAIGQFPSRRKNALPPPLIRTRLAAHVKARSRDGKIFDTDLLVSPLRQYGIELGGTASALINLDASTWKITHADLGLKVAELQTVVHALNRTQFAIPAPLNELSGPAFLRIGDDRAIEKGNLLVLPVTLQTRFHSPTQSLLTDGKGDLTFDFNPFSLKARFDLALTRIQLQAPTLNPIVPIPMFTRDERIIDSKSQAIAEKDLADQLPKKPTRAAAFRMDLHIHTADQPVRILYPHFAPAAAFFFDFNQTDAQDSPELTVRFEPMQVHFLSRDATLQKLVIRKGNGSDGLLMIGRLMLQRAGYMIYADINQIAGKAKIDLQSDPPLSEDDIVSLILFNQVSDQLDSSNANSVQDTRTALSNRALGFFSFWALSSTPVEAVAYDPTTKMYSARVKLPGQITATVGSNWDQAQEVGLRKRLSKRWSITAESRMNGTTTGPGASAQSTQETMLEWYNRY